MSKTFKDISIGTKFTKRDSPYIYIKVSDTKAKIEWISTINKKSSVPIGSERLNKFGGYKS